MLRSVFGVLILGLLIFFNEQVFGQTDTSATEMGERYRKHFIFSPGLSYQKQYVGEVGVIYGITEGGGPCNPGGLFGVKLATEFNFKSSNLFIAPKLAVELDFLILGVRLNVIDYTDFTYHDFKITPEIGISLMGALDVFYGYNYSLTDKRVDDIVNHRFTLTLNLDRTFW